MEYIVPASIIAAAIVLIGLLIRRAVVRRPAASEHEQSFLLLQNQVNATAQQTAQQMQSLRETMNESVQALTAQLGRSLSETNKTVGNRLDNTTKVIGDVRQQLGQLEQSSRQLIDLGRDISKLEDILRPPKLRGALGELFLADLLAQVLPASHYKLQYRFRGGETVDAVVMLRSGLVPIDAKFPLENFRRIVDAEGDETRLAARRTFIKDVKIHIDAIAAKYIRMDEDTFDFALMYVPAENVYYETLIKDDEFGGEMSLYAFALKKRVIPVSPNSFYAYLQTIILGLKGMRVEERSREILEKLSRLQKEFDNFSEAFRLVGQHLDNSQKKYTEAQKRFGKVEAKVEQIDGLARGLESEEQSLPAADDAPAELPQDSVDGAASGVSADTVVGGR